MNASDELPEKLSEGDFMRLFVKHEPALRAFARCILPDWDSVDDALQEASVTMWEKLGQLRDQEGFLPWAKVILRFKCLAAITNMRRHRSVLSEEVLNLLVDEAEEQSSEDVARVRRTLMICLTQFSDAHQELLLAPYQKGGRITQLARQSGRSPNALYKLLGRLREKLATCIRGQLQLDVS